MRGRLTYQGGMAGSGGAGAAATIQGNVRVEGGDISADDIGLKPHTHYVAGAGAQTGPATA
ncbi:hypothetical protein [Chitiniphilus shinanonensis]|uniref:hypothetical protein n=1 Tax=Chitiniphilus shinanonensis TaxID=553088 RepID=UPI00333FA3B2